MPNLPVPAWATVTPGQFDTSALFNTVSNNGQFLSNIPLFVGQQSSVQSTTNGGWTTLTFDVNIFDTYGGHSTVTNNSRYTAQVAGYYTAVGVAAFAVNSTGSRGTRLSKNGSVIAGSGQLVGAGTLNATVASSTTSVFLAVGDYLEVSAGQNSGGALSTSNGGESTCQLWVAWAHT